MTKHMYVFRDINWCKAVIDDLRQAALIWRSEKHKTIPGCALLLQIFYLDNLRCNCSIQHKLLPRARFFDNCTMQNIIIEDKRKDKVGKETYGKLPLKNIASTCYHFFEPDSNESPEEACSTSSNTFPSIIGELGGLVSQIANTSSRNNAFEGMKVFDAKARKAIESVQKGSKMLVEAHSEFISTIWSILQSEVVEKRMEDNQHLTTPSIDITMSNVASHQNRCGESSAVQTDQPHSAAPSNEISDEPQKLHSHQGDAGAFPEELQSHLPLQTDHDGTPRRMAPDCFSFAPDIDAVIRELSQAEKMQHAASVATNHDHGQLSKNGDEVMPLVSINTTIPPAPCHNVGSCSDPMSPMFGQPGFFLVSVWQTTPRTGKKNGYCVLDTLVLLGHIWIEPPRRQFGALILWPRIRSSRNRPHVGVKLH
ncbi:uncharacterized protein LOC133904791 isoform X1 [Phragmites australis]|uniref:uncharacterized protein LOC133904791 isoform X1 n=1 Tax=Phragmites australis TaxID=29695 RepID=UPI002D78A566|nr:uncharacterized protein LOC133904791 isoform X1 [Phragmites australis]